MQKPAEFELLVDALRSLPGVGTKNAKKWAFFLLKQDTKYIDDFVKRIKKAHTDIKHCVNCGVMSNDVECYICANQYRDHTKLMIVTTNEDVERIESANIYNGLYFITGGEISFRKNVVIEHTNLKQLADYVSTKKFTEIIVATSFSHDGEVTAAYIVDLFKNNPDINVYRIGFGLPLNSSVDYADDETLKQAIYNKRILK
ncbi:recombination mediator RecR [Ureaplasma miroungigenitalium]|uniref:Recombination protein RecR n=1 Tax=Ureaplasma miroungigenitalium TaxID=1042321 RepID=A0ABT3BN60_9BACT|nr:recombination mediator RecR [Ureaplasma miroungigenitalium]MCV3728678.1 recombination mediator RecR [Ureaplasma miroungigenitalium]MCV3734369.1 recombination mediator RecR [Ureaplasma miroungigenitalium]